VGVAKRLGKGAVEVNHHLGDTAFSRRDKPFVATKTELPAQGRLQAVTVEDFAFDLGRVSRPGKRDRSASDFC
jgi:hypothetical protein